MELAYPHGGLTADTPYDFNHVIDRHGTGSLKYDCARERGKSPDLLPLWVADMDFPIPREAVTALVERSRHGIFGYTEPDAAYFAAAQAWIARHQHWTPDPATCVLTPGVVFALAAAVRAYSKPGDAVLIQPPVYYPFKEVIEDNGRTVARAPLTYRDGSYSLDRAAFERALDETHATLFLLCNPHNPVGRVWTREELQDMARACERRGVQVVSDEIHADFARPGFTHTSIMALGGAVAEHAVVCTSPGKTFNLAGLQDSNIFIPSTSRRDAFKHAVAAAGYSQMNTMGLVAGRACYEHGESWYQQMMAYVEDNIRFTSTYLAEHAPLLHLVEPQSTYLLWVDCRALKLSEDELHELVERDARLWVDFGDIFGPEGEGFIRLNVACPRSTVEQALRQLCHAVQGAAGAHA